MNLPGLALLGLALVAVPGARSDETVERTLAELQAGTRRPLKVTAPALNAWLASPGVLPPGVARVVVSIQSSNVQLSGEVDVERYKHELPPGLAAAAGYLGGVVPVEVVARLDSGGGYGSVEVESLAVASVPFPVSFVAPLVATFTRSERQPDGFDLSQRFALPAGLERVRFEPGVAWLEPGTDPRRSPR